MCPNSCRCLWILKMPVLLLVLGVVLFMFRSVYLYTQSSNHKPRLPHPAPAAGMLKLLPEEHVRSLFAYDGIWWDNKLFHLGLTFPSCGSQCPVVPTLQPVPYLPAPVLIANVIPNHGTRKRLGLQGTERTKSLTILEGLFNPNHRKDAAFLSLWPPLLVGVAEMPLTFLRLSSL